jgi:CheY-like chemotaxis protein
MNKGTGLGLASVHGIVVSHHGFLCVDTTVDRGSAFQMFLPLQVGEAARDEDEEDADNSPIKEARILVVDDQPDMRSVTCTMLQRAGFEAFDSASPTEALELIMDNPAHFDVVVSDYAMPGMTGVELANAAYMVAPELPFILVSGYAETETQEKIAACPAVRGFIKKPIQSPALLGWVRTVLTRD